MPMRSQAQWRYLFANHMPFAERWAKATPGGKGARFRRLPNKKRKELTLKAQADDTGGVVARKPTPAPASGGGGKGGGYGARAGQQIRGNLFRGADGKFHAGAGGGGKKASGRKSGGGGGKAAKPKKSDAEKQAERDAKKAQTAAEQQAERNANSKKVGEQSPLGQNLHAALMEFSSPDENIALAPQNQDALVKAGMVELDSDGNARMTAAGRNYVHAAETGDVRRANDAVSEGVSRYERRAAIDKRRADAEAKKAEKKGGGGGGGKPKPTDAEKLAQKQQAAQQLATQTAPKVGLKPVDVDALRTAAEGGSVKEADIDGLAQLGFITATGNNQFEATAAGRAALSALEKGDLRAYQAAKQRGAADTAKQAAQAIQKLATPAKTMPVRTTKSRAAWRVALKAQTDQEKAMFAAMGSGGKGGGSGKGGKGGSKLWPKGPDGKRTPQAAAAQTRARSGERTPAKSEPKTTPAQRRTGTETRAYGADPNTTYTMRHKLVDMSEIQASNTRNGAINEKYDPRLQPRDRSRAASQAQIDTVARQLNPDVLATDFHRIDAGSPIIDKHGNVLSGNGRTLALQRAMESHPEKYAEYKARIREEAKAQGIDPREVDRMKNPVLVRELRGDADPVAFSREANSSGTLRMSPLEQAKVDASTLHDRTMLKLNVNEGQDIDKALRSKENKPFIDDFLATVPANERANLLTKNGELNQMGLYRAKAAVYTRTFPGEAGERMAESMLESLDPDVKQVQNGISAGLPAMSRARSLITSGQRDADLDISEDFAKAVDVLARVRDNPHLTENTPMNKVVAKYLSQSTMFDRELNADQEKLLVHIDSISRKPTAVRDLLQRYQQIVEGQPQPGQSSLFGDMPSLTKSQLIDLLINGKAAPGESEQGSMF